MGYYMRFIASEKRDIDLMTVEAAFKKFDPSYHFEKTDIPDLSDLFHGDTLLARVEINYPGDEIFDDDISEFKDLVGLGSTPQEQQVLQILGSAQAMVVIEALWEGTESEPVLKKIDPLWDWLLDHYPGVLQADLEGFYDSSGLIVERNFML